MPKLRESEENVSAPNLAQNPVAASFDATKAASTAARRPQWRGARLLLGTVAVFGTVYGALGAYVSVLNSHRNDAEFRRLGVPVTAADWPAPRTLPKDQNAADEIRAFSTYSSSTWASPIDNAVTLDDRALKRIEEAVAQSHLDFGWRPAQGRTSWSSVSSLDTISLSLQGMVKDAALANDVGAFVRVMVAQDGLYALRRDLNHPLVPASGYAQLQRRIWMVTGALNANSRPEFLHAAERALMRPVERSDGRWKAHALAMIGARLSAIRDESWAEDDILRPIKNRFGTENALTLAQEIYRRVQNIPALRELFLARHRAAAEREALSDARDISRRPDSARGQKGYWEAEGNKATSWERYGLELATWPTAAPFRLAEVRRQNLLIAIRALRIRNQTGAFPLRAGPGYRRHADGKGFTVQAPIDNVIGVTQVVYPTLHPREIRGYSQGSAPDDLFLFRNYFKRNVR